MHLTLVDSQTGVTNSLQRNKNKKYKKITVHIEKWDRMVTVSTTTIMMEQAHVKITMGRL